MKTLRFAAGGSEIHQGDFLHIIAKEVKMKINIHVCDRCGCNIEGDAYAHVSLSSSRRELKYELCEHCYNEMRKELYMEVDNEQ